MNAKLDTPDPQMPLVVSLLGLTFVTGVIDAISFLGLGRVFTANMTGNVVFLGFALGGGASDLSVTPFALRAGCVRMRRHRWRADDYRIATDTRRPSAEGDELGDCLSGRRGRRGYWRHVLR